MDGIKKAINCLMMAMSASETNNPKLLTLKGLFIIEALAWFTWGEYQIYNFYINFTNFHTLFILICKELSFVLRSVVQ